MNYPPGVTGNEDIFKSHTPAEYHHETAISWVWDSKKGLVDDFNLYAEENFPDVVEMFKAKHQPFKCAPGDEISDNYSLWHDFIWSVLDDERLEIILRSFAESNWDSYEEFVGE